MNLKPIIDEMRAFWLEGQTGGQVLLGGYEAHYDIERTPLELTCMLQDSVCRKRPQPIYYWEIQAEEQTVNIWS
jgi:hypothetical protein